MNPATRRTEGNATAPLLHMALELSNTSWRLAFGDGATRRQLTVPMSDIFKASWPFVWIIMLGMVVTAVLPPLVTWLPNLMSKK